MLGKVIANISAMKPIVMQKMPVLGLLGEWSLLAFLFMPKLLLRVWLKCVQPCNLVHYVPYLGRDSGSGVVE